MDLSDSTGVDMDEPEYGAGDDAVESPSARHAPHHDRRGKRLSPLLIVAGVVAVAVVLALVFAPYPATIDGSLRFVPRGATVDDLTSRGFFASPRGNLLSVKGGVLKEHGGGDPVVTSGGRQLAPTSTIGLFATVTSAPGPDVKEKTLTLTKAISPETIYVGSGGMETVTSTGSPGATKVTVGEVSGIELSSEVVTPAIPKVVLRGAVQRGPKYIALTFDDGPWPGQTEKILEILKREGARATFFMLGMKIQRSPSLAKAVVQSGNEIGTHSQTHKMLGKSPNATVTYEIATGANTLRRYTGIKPHWYRPAGGSVSPFVYSEANRLGLQVILWTLDTHDYTKPGAKVIADRVIGNAKNGSVVLMHDGGGDRAQTIAALPIIIESLRARGFRFVTLTELYNRPNPPKMPVHP
jgi:peptidoglycan/xylan/chitin deacetylase (PgdA/CDA1 family)